MVQRDRIAIWIATRDYTIEEYESYDYPIRVMINFVQMDNQMLMEVTGQTDTGYASIVYPACRGDLLHVGDRFYLSEPTNFDGLALDANYEVTEVVGKRIVSVTAKALS